ncbi:MAG: tellurium resistance protein TerC [Desulfobacteraceae bacterium]|nr:tellurium resistance protein TerC [Desulfobacteraceae bacterium]MBC2754466.1 tellurium resistance protein TerC [Desulfobacteraceae bacterium]
METVFTIDNLITLGLLTLLQAVLGFDNLLYISIESKRAPAEKQAMVRRLGIGIAVILRIILLFALMKVISYFKDPLFALHVKNILHSSFNLHSLVVLLGGGFIIYTATREILHMMSIEDMEAEDRKSQSTGLVIFWIVSMNVVFSFDSILSAMALSDVFWVMAVAIIAGGVLMIWLADRVALFLQKNRMYEVLGLFILFVVGIMLVTEGGHLAHLRFFGHEVIPMSKATFYFVISVLVLTDFVQGRYQKKLMRMKELKIKS